MPACRIDSTGCDKSLSRVSKGARANNCHGPRPVGINPTLIKAKGLIPGSNATVETDGRTQKCSHYTRNRAAQAGALDTHEVHLSVRALQTCFDIRF